MEYNDFQQANQRHLDLMEQVKFALSMAGPEERDQLERSVVHQYLSLFLHGLTDKVKLNPINLSLALTEAGQFTRQMLEKDGLWPAEQKKDCQPASVAGYL